VVPRRRRTSGAAALAAFRTGAGDSFR